MKKILYSLILCLTSLISYWTILSFSNKQFIKQVNPDGFYMIIDVASAATPIEKENIVKCLAKVSKQCDLILSKITYNFSSDADISSVNIYTTDFSPYRVNIFRGQLPKAGEFLSTVETFTKNQSGLLKMFDKDNIYYIYNFEDNTINFLSEEYYVNAENFALFEDFLSQLKNNGINVRESNGVLIDDFDSALLHNVFTLIMVLAIIIIIVNTYMVLSSNSEIAIKKLYGYSDFKIWIEHFVYITPKISFHICLLTSITCNIVLFFYNSNIQFFEFIIYLFKNYLIVLIPILIISAFINWFCIYGTTIKMQIKGKYPHAFILSMLIFTKIIITVLIFFNMFQLLETYQLKNVLLNNLSNLSILNNYGEFVLHGEGVPNAESDYLLSKRCQDLFAAENEKGGILFDATSGAKGHYSLKLNDQYYWRNNLVYINNNYLALNPIYDINNNLICYDDQYTDNVTLLIPNKFRKYEKDILEDFSDSYHSVLHISEDLYRDFLQLPQINYEKKEINLVYIKDDQGYYTYNPKCLPKFNYTIRDCVAVVVNNVNMGSDNYSAYISSGAFKIKLNDSNTSLEQYYEYLKYLKLEKDVVLLKNSYDDIQTYKGNLDKNMSKTTWKFFINCFVLIILVFILTSILIGLLKKQYCVEFLLGFSRFRQNRTIYIISFFSCMISLLVIISIYTVSLAYILPIFAFFVCLDSILINIVCKNNILQILKGD